MARTIKAVSPRDRFDHLLKVLASERFLRKQGLGNEVPFFMMIHGAGVMGLADGPTEVHKMTVAKQVLRDYRPSDDLWPTEWIPGRIEAAKQKFGDLLEHEVGNL